VEAGSLKKALTLQDGSVAGLDCERSNIGNDFWTSFEYDQKYADWARNSLEIKAIIKLRL